MSTATALPAIAAATAQAGLANVRAPLRLDVLAPHWPAEGPPFCQPFDADLLRQHAAHRALGHLRRR